MKSSVDIITFAGQLQSRVKERIDALDTAQDDLLRIGHLLSFMRSIIEELKVFTSKYSFADEAEEIRFFKESKPVLVSQYFYYRKIFNIRLSDSFKDAKSRQAHYHQLLQKLEQFVKKNEAFYEYCMTSSSYLDRLYFTRSKQETRSINHDTQFTTGYDTTLARILANELLKKHILSALQRTRTETEEGVVLTWTGPKASLIELIYALHSVEVFNKGKADIKLIASAFETLFNISLGNYYRVMQEIRIRKSGQTNFLDHLKEKLQKRIDEYE